MSTKAVFLDLDGTLLDDDKRISEGNRAAIDCALQAGHKVLICTGRPICSARAQAELLGLNKPGCFTVASNGAVIYDMEKQTVIYRRTMDLPLVYGLFDEANRRNLHIQTYADDYVIAEPRCQDEPLERYVRIIKVPYRILGDIRRLTEAPPKCVVLSPDSREAAEDFRKWVLEWGGGRLDAFFSTPILLEIMPKGQNKGAAVEMVSEILGIPMQDTVAVGDAPNDSSMIAAAGLGVCMANGMDEVKALADYITEHDNNHSGVAEVFRKFVL